MIIRETCSRELDMYVVTSTGIIGRVTHCQYVLTAMLQNETNIHWSVGEWKFSIGSESITVEAVCSAKGVERALHYILKWYVVISKNLA